MAIFTILGVIALVVLFFINQIFDQVVAISIGLIGVALFTYIIYVLVKCIVEKKIVYIFLIVGIVLFLGIAKMGIFTLGDEVYRYTFGSVALTPMLSFFTSMIIPGIIIAVIFFLYDEKVKLMPSIANLIFIIPIVAIIFVVTFGVMLYKYFNKGEYEDTHASSFFSYREDLNYNIENRTYKTPEEVVKAIIDDVKNTEDDPEHYVSAISNSGMRIREKLEDEGYGLQIKYDADNWEMDLEGNTISSQTIIFYVIDRADINNVKYYTILVNKNNLEIESCMQTEGNQDSKYTVYIVSAVVAILCMGYYIYMGKIGKET